MPFEKLSEFFELASKNKVLSALLALVTASVGVLVEDVYNRPQEEAELRAMVTAMDSYKAEVEAGRAMVTSYEGWRRTLGEATKRLEHSLDRDALGPQSLVATTRAAIRDAADARKVGSTYRAKLATPQIFSPELKDLRDSLVRDMEQTDQFPSTRMEFLQVMMTNLPKAVEMAATLRYNLDGWKAGQEADARSAVIDKVMERLRVQYNDKVAAGNAKLSMHRWRQRRVIAAMACVGATVGGVATWSWMRLRRRRHADEPEIRLKELSPPGNVQQGVGVSPSGENRADTL